MGTEHGRERGPDATLAAVLEATGEPTVLYGADGRTVFVNEALVEAFRVERSRVVGRSPEALRDAVEQESVTAERPGDRPMLAVDCDGDRRWYERRSRPVRSGRYDGGTLERFVEVTDSRRREVEIRELYEITSSADLSFDEKVNRLLDVGRERLGLDVGFLSRIRDGQLHVTHARGSHELLQPGSVSDLTETYCRRTVESDSSLVVDDCRDAGWASDPAYEKYGLECYVGVELQVNGDLYGTFCFADRTAKDATFSEAERTFVELMGSWVGNALERRHRERQLGALDENSRAMLEAADREAVCDIAVRAAESDLDVPVVAVSLLDDDGVLSPVAQTAAAAESREGSRTLPGGTDHEWQAFAENQLQVVDLPADADIASGLVVPLGRQGVLVVGAESPDAFSEVDVDIARALGASTQAALDRTSRERALREREETLAEQNEQLERLNRVNDVIRTIDRSLVRASTREAVERAVCEELADTGPYRAAWISESGPLDEGATLSQRTESDAGFLDDLRHASDELSASFPPLVAARSREVQVVDDVLEDPPLTAWRQRAMRRGYRSLVSLPLSYDDTRYGVLTVFSERPGVFGDLEREVLVELGDTIAYAIDAVERKHALVSDDAVELDLRVTDPAVLGVRLTAETDATLALESVTEGDGTDGSVGLLLSVTGPSPGTVEPALRSALFADDLSLLSESDGRLLYRCRGADRSVVSTLREHGAVLRSLDAVDGVATLSVEIPYDADVRAFVEMMRAKYPATELVAKRQVTRRPRAGAELRTEFESRLTSRQQEVLRLAFYAGVFDDPRTCSITDLAGRLEVSQPTVSRHLRKGQRELLSLVLEE
ncbi:bacterio-opsin activator domain-containing protein [Halobium salinum]|uniref:Bacterio-opsin activator domain-containing protein n=1 Tax=Halobium salinum TaxID=1364940 RepID=A0ABD5P6U3_9EURY|nr:GAF domain-containing protein [Halobium salinum]